MPSQVPQSRDQTPFSHGDQLDFHRSQLEVIKDDVWKAYEPTPESATISRSNVTPLGAAATQYEPGSAAEHAVSYEKIELTLEQLGKNIESMRADAMNKVVNPAPIEFTTRTDYRSDFDLAS